MVLSCRVALFSLWFFLFLPRCIYLFSAEHRVRPVNVLSVLVPSLLQFQLRDVSPNFQLRLVSLI